MWSGSPVILLKQENTEARDFEDTTGSFGVFEGTSALELLNTGMWVDIV